MACGILVPQRGMEPMCPVVEVQSLNHWTPGEVPLLQFKLDISSISLYEILHIRKAFDVHSLDGTSIKNMVNFTDDKAFKAC